MRYRLTRQASEKATTVPEVGCGLSRRSTDRNTPGKSPAFRDIGVGISRISQEAAGHWRSIELATFCVRMMGRFTHAALSFKVDPVRIVLESPLDHVALVVEDEDDRLGAVASHRGDLIGSELMGALAGDEHGSSRSVGQSNTQRGASGPTDQAPLAESLLGRHVAGRFHSGAAARQVLVWKRFIALTAHWMPLTTFSSGSPSRRVGLCACAGSGIAPSFP